MTSKTWVEQVIARAWEDAAFKQELLRNPRVAVQKLTGVVLPDDFELNVVEETQNTLYLVLPAPTDELSDAELSFVAGGGWGNPRRNPISRRPVGSAPNS